DQIVSGTLSVIPKPMRHALPNTLRRTKKSGTLILWTRCDRLDHRRVSTIERRLHAGLGRIFRHFLWAGTEISLNGKIVEPVDPIFLRNSFKDGTATQFQKIDVEVATDPGNPSSPAGEIEILFTELPVAEWHEISNDEKR